MNFQSPEYFWLFGLVPLFFILFYFEKKFLKSRLSKIAPLTHLGLLVSKGLQAPSRGMLVLRVVAVIFLVFSLTRPSWTFKWQEVKHEGIDVMVLLDVSKSMLAEDISPNRLQRAKRKLQDLLDLMKGDRFGLIVFAGSAHVEVPLTIDYSAAKQFIENVDLTSVPYQGTNMGAAIELATASLSSAALSKQEGGQGKAILLLTDGEDHTGFAQKASLEAKEKGVKLFTVGIGSPRGAPIPLPQGGFQKDRSGNVVLSKYDANLLKELASITGGVFAKSVAGDLDLNTIYVNGIRKKFETQLLNEQRVKNWTPQSHWFVMIGLIFMLLSLIWEKQRMVKTIAVLLFVGLGTFTPRSAMANSESEAYEQYKKRDFKAAEKKYLEAEREAPEDPEIIYNRAVTQYKNGNFEGAKEGFEKVERLTQDKALKDKARFNLGNTQFKMQKPDEAIKTYESLLKENPEQQQVKENLQAAVQYKKILEQQKQQQQQNQNSNNQNKDQKNQENKENQQQSQNQQNQEQQNNQQQQNSEQQNQEQQSQNQESKNAEKNQQDSEQQKDKEQEKQEDLAKSQDEKDGEKSEEEKQKEQEQAGNRSEEEKQKEEKQRAGLNDSQENKEEQGEESEDQQQANNEEGEQSLDQNEESKQKDSQALQKSAKTLSKEEALRYLRTLKEGSPKGKKFSNQRNASQDGKDW